jgi:hypothetical protein
MPFVRTALMATAACLIGAAAYAQTSTPDQAPPAGASQPMSQPAPDNTAPPAASSDMSSAPSTGSTTPSAPTASPDQTTGNSGATNAAPATSAPSTAAPDTSAAVGTPANTSTTVDANGNQVIASQPVPDTRANRAAYGQPLSNAGKHTAPAGN